MRMATFQYDGNKGAAYAKRFAQMPELQRIFYTASGKDCTNFISQCVWAAFGGYITSGPNYLATAEDDERTKKNIKNRVLMTTGGGYKSSWYGGLIGEGGSLCWESVDAFWNYTTGQTSQLTGPHALGYNSQQPYNNISLYEIKVGDVLQFKNSSNKYSKYTHSAYVSEITAEYQYIDYNNILVCQHSFDLKNRPLSDVILTFGESKCYMRKLSFMTSNFIIK